MESNAATVTADAILTKFMTESFLSVDIDVNRGPFKSFLRTRSDTDRIRRTLTYISKHVIAYRIMDVSLNAYSFTLRRFNETLSID